MTREEIRFLPPSVRRASGPVFHYTSSAGLLAMVSAGTAWASESSSLNDIAEVRQGWEALARVLASRSDGAAVQLLRALANDPLKRKHEVFVLCASTAGDDANQWRVYADGGHGYAIELDGNVQLAAVSDRARTRPASARGPRVRSAPLMDGVSVTPWLHVIYEETHIETLVDELLATISAEIQFLATVPEEASDLVADGIRDDAHEALATVAHLIKTPGFSGENEVRVVATFDFGNEHVQYRAGQRGIVGFANLTQSPDGRGGMLLRPDPGSAVETTLPIKSVRLGPLLGEEHINTVRSYVRRYDNGRNIDVTSSDVPLR